MNIKFDYELCVSCGLCRKSCGSKRIGVDPDSKPFKIEELGCSDCGHCVAVCPSGAVTNDRMGSSEFAEMIDPNISLDQFSNLVRNRRSIRNYTTEPLSKDHIDKLLQVVKYIPTGSNKQSLKYKFIVNPDLLQAIKEEMAVKFRRVSRIAHSFPVKYFVAEKSRQSLKRLVDLWDEGNDPYLRNAPCLLLIYTDQKYYSIPQWDAGIASNTIDLAAQTMGVATLMNGFYVVNSQKFKSINKASGIPPKHDVLAALCLGYPGIKYKRTVSRKPLDVVIA